MIKRMSGAALRIVLLWVLLALLPLRGWAAGLMAVDALPAGSAGQVHATAPCHGAHEVPQAPAAGDAAADADAAPAASDLAEHFGAASALCGDCDLCHAPMVPPAGRGLAPLPLSDAPDEAQPRDTGRLMASWLERPPRP